MKSLLAVFFPCMVKMKAAQKRGETALHELTKVCDDDRCDLSSDKKKFPIMAVIR